MKKKDYWHPVEIGEWLADTAFLTLATAGAYAHLRANAWNASTRGVLCMTMDGYARLLRATVDQASRVIDELVKADCGIVSREDLDDGHVRLTIVRDAHRAKVSAARSAAGSKGGRSSVLLKQKSKQTSDYDYVGLEGAGRKGGKAAGHDVLGGESPSPDPFDDDTPAEPAIPDDDPAPIGTPYVRPTSPEFFDEDVPMSTRVRAWLNAIPGFCVETCSAKHLGTLTAQTEKYGWPHVKSAVVRALKQGAKVPAAYAISIVESDAAKQFAAQPKPIHRGQASQRTWRPG